MKDEKLQKVYSQIIHLCVQLNALSKEFLVSLDKNGGNNNCTMAFFFFIRQIELFDSVIMLSGHRKFNAMSILVRAMLENTAHLYYSGMDSEYADKWAAYQYVDMLRSYEQKIEKNIEVKSENIEYLLRKLEEHCMQFVNKGLEENFKKSFQDKTLPKGGWYKNSWGGSVTCIIEKVSEDIDRVNKEAIGESYIKDCLRGIYYELSLKAHVKPQGFANDFKIENDTLRLKDDWIIEDVRTLLPAIEYMTRTVDIANTRFEGKLRDKLQVIANKTEALTNLFVSFVTSYID